MEKPYLYRSNLIGIPTPIFASPNFNLSNQTVHIRSVRELNKPLFAVLERYGEADQCPLFLEHIRAMFGIDHKDRPGGHKPFKADLVRLLRGWFFDSNRPEAAVLKGWAESRFGLRTLFHREFLKGPTDPAYYIYMSERQHPRFHHNCVFSQLDLVYEYTQQYLRRFANPEGFFTLYRGFNGEGENQILERCTPKKWVIRSNNLVSFSQEIERACEFGDRIIEIRAPFSKIFCLPRALPTVLPHYEAEVMVLGGDYYANVIDYYQP